MVRRERPVITIIPTTTSTVVHLALPKGRIESQIVRLMSDAGLELRGGDRGYRPHAAKVIAERLHISVRTIESHKRHIMKKIDRRSVAELTKYAIREGLTSLED